jgi:hypothetical protein
VVNLRRAVGPAITAAMYIICSAFLSSSMLQLPFYSSYATKSQFEYEFESIGPKGTIKKIARFRLEEGNVYSFGFGDLDEATGDVSDIVVSNNQDRDKVLATLAHIIYHFTGNMSNALIFIQGSTPARTRLYQQGINKFKLQLEPEFEIIGYQNYKWETFTTGKNYEAFLGWRKV